MINISEFNNQKRVNLYLHKRNSQAVYELTGDDGGIVKRIVVEEEMQNRWLR